MITVFKFNCKRKIQHLTRWFKINDGFKELTAFPSQKQTNVNLTTFKQHVSSSQVMTSQCHMTHSWCEPCGAWLQPAASEPCTTWFPDSISSSDARGIIFSDQAVRPHMPPASWRAASQHRCNVDVSSRSCLTEWQPGAEGGGIRSRRLDKIDLFLLVGVSQFQLSVVFILMKSFTWGRPSG